MQKAVTCKREAENYITFTHATDSYQGPSYVYQGKHVVSRYFRRSYLKANKVSKSEGTRNIEHAYHF